MQPVQGFWKHTHAPTLREITFIVDEDFEVEEIGTLQTIVAFLAQRRQSVAQRMDAAVETLHEKRKIPLDISRTILSHYLWDNDLWATDPNPGERWEYNDMYD